MINRKIEISAPQRNFIPGADAFAAPPKAKGRRGRPKLARPKEAITLRLDHDLIAYFKNKGRYWRAEMRKALIKAMQAEQG